MESAPVSRVLSSLIIYLGENSRLPSINLPASTSSQMAGTRTSSPDFEAYLVFQPIRFAMRLLSPADRWSLTPPFHPYHA